jgi:mRNA interferase MazF
LHDHVISIAGLLDQHLRSVTLGVRLRRVGDHLGLGFRIEPGRVPTRPRSRLKYQEDTMRRGEVWWAEFDERRPVVLLSGEGPSEFRAMQVVAPADTDISGLGIEVAVGFQEGLPFDGVLRFAFARPGFTPCTWLTTLSREDLIERAGAVSAAKLSEIDDALRASEQRAEWTPAAVARLSEIKDSVRRRTQADG